MEKNNEVKTDKFTEKLTQHLFAKPERSIFYSGFFPIVFALISQYGYGLHPCDLCVYQRVPFIMVMVFGAIAFFVKSPKIIGYMLGLTVISYFANFGIAFFHVGVEQKWWVYGECSAALDMSSIESLKKALLDAPSVRCDDVQFRFFGLSMAGWNVVYSVLASIFFLREFVKLKTEK